MYLKWLSKLQKKDIKRLDAITELMQSMSQEIKTTLPKLYSKELLDILFRSPSQKDKY